MRTFSKKSAVLAAAFAGVALVSGCSGSGDDPANTAAKGGVSVSPTSPSSTSPTAADAASPTPSASTTTPPADAEPTSAQPLTGDVITDADLVVKAAKLGCSDPEVKKAAPGHKTVATGVNCKAGTTDYILMRTLKPGMTAAAAKSMHAAVNPEQPMSYVHGDNWMLVASADNKTTLLAAAYEPIRAKIGGTIDTDK